MPLPFLPLPPPLATLIPVLLAVWALSFAAGLLVGDRGGDPTRRLARPARLVMIALVLAAGLALWLIAARGREAAGYARWIVAGLVCGAAGDLVLGGFLPLRRPTLTAIGLFALGHAAYLLAIFTLRAALLPPGWFSVAILVIPALFAGALLWEFAAHTPGRDPALNRASFFYALLLTVVLVLAAYFPIRARILYTLGVGMGLFAVSDVILAGHLLRGRTFRLQHDLVWILYSSGQMLIALSIAEAARLLP